MELHTAREDLGVVQAEVEFCDGKEVGKPYSERLAELESAENLVQTLELRRSTALQQLAEKEKEVREFHDKSPLLAQYEEVKSKLKLRLLEGHRS